MSRNVQLLCGFILVVAMLVASILGLVLRRGMQSDSAGVLDRIVRLERGNAQQVLEHRDANQGDHDCIVGLALLLADPARNRSEAIIPPPSCNRSPGLDAAEDNP